MKEKQGFETLDGTSQGGSVSRTLAVAIVLTAATASAGMLLVSRVAFNSARRCNRRRSRPARYWRVFGERDGHDRETDSYRVPSTLDIAPRDALPANARERLRGCLRGDPPSDWVAM